MTCVEDQDTAPSPPLGRRGGQAMWQPARDRFPARAVADAWPAASRPRREVMGELTAPPFILGLPRAASGRGAAGSGCSSTGWKISPGRRGRNDGLPAALTVSGRAGARCRVAGSAGTDMTRRGGSPGCPRRWGWRSPLTWCARRCGGSWLAVPRAACSSLSSPPRVIRPGSRCCGSCATTIRASASAAGKLALYRAAVIAAAKGGGVGQITVGDVAELLALEAVRAETAGGQGGGVLPAAPGGRDYQ